MIKEIYYEKKYIYKNICLYNIIKKKIILKNKKNKNLLTL